MPPQQDEKRQPTTIGRSDFAVGMFLGLTARGVKAIDVSDIVGFHRAVEMAFKEAERELDGTRYSFRFLVIRHPFHETSPDVSGMMSYLKSIYYVVARDLFEPHFLRMKPVGDPMAYMERAVPGQPEMYLKAADTIMANFSGFRM